MNFSFKPLSASPVAVEMQTGFGFAGLLSWPFSCLLIPSSQRWSILFLAALRVLSQWLSLQLLAWCPLAA